MKKGVVLIAHNNRTIDYARMSIISGGLAKRHLKVPVSLITDESTVRWMKDSGIYNDAEMIFENIILTERPEIDNRRKLNDGSFVEYVPFLNSTRDKVFDLTPYDRTLLIDTDFLIFSDRLSNYWEVDEDVLIAESMNDVQGDRIGILDKKVSETGIHLYWATTVMFSKTEYSKTFFRLVEYIKENYNFFADLYRFDPQQYRNDISFSIAKHILEGFEKSNINLPPLLTVQDRDLISLIKESSLKILIQSNVGNETYYPCSIKDQDLHLMNKQSIVKNYDHLKELI